jgi:hypothetical protein
MKTAAIISYCSYHNPFIERCIAEARKCADYVLVVSHSHFYDGQEDGHRLNLTALPCDYSVLEWVPGQAARYYHNELRKYGLDQVQGDFDAYFFIDADEILEGDRVKTWLENEAQPGEDYKLAHFWYYRDTCWRADEVEEGAVLLSKESAQVANWWGDRERENFSSKWNYMTGYQRKVLGHHYSWAGTKGMLLRKVKSWGHNKDGNWSQMVEEEFQGDFRGCPFRPNYNFTKVEPYIGFTFNENG